MKNCLNCQKLFKPLVQSKGMYCSRRCADIHKVPWNKGKKIDASKYLSYGHTGLSHSEETKQRISAIKRNDPFIRNEYAPRWKGNHVGYTALHDWAKKRLIKPQTCRFCNKEKPLDLSNISGDYKRDLSDWQWLCRSCHRKYDKEFGISAKEIFIKSAFGYSMRRIKI